jgi:hypothetical protein
MSYLNRCYDILPPFSQNGKTPIFYAVANGHKDVVAVLLEKGANPEAAERKVLCHYRHSILHLLGIQTGCNSVYVALCFQDSRKLLQCAVEAGHKEIVSLLLEKGAHASPQDTDVRLLCSVSVGEKFLMFKNNFTVSLLYCSHVCTIFVYVCTYMYASMLPCRGGERHFILLFLRATKISLLYYWKKGRKWMLAMRYLFRIF